MRSLRLESSLLERVVIPYSCILREHISNKQSPKIHIYKDISHLRLELEAKVDGELACKDVAHF